MLLRLFFITLLATISTTLAARGTYQEPEAFLEEVFDGTVPEPAVVWLTGARKQAIESILGHPYSSLRVRYWLADARSAWILEEIGKDQPITVGMVINNGQIERVKVLVFRESRGWEIRHPFFTDQFRQADLDADLQLDRQIDGISGATLSVRAVKKIARMALFLDNEIRQKDVTPAP